MKIIADSAIPFLRGVLEPWAEIHYIPGSKITPADIHDADVLIVRTRTRCNADLLEGSSVRLIATATIGFDHIDTGYCHTHGIRVATAAGCNARGVLQWIAAALAYLSLTEGWQANERTLGIVGVGHVGSLVKEHAENWGFRVLCCDPPREMNENIGFRSLTQVAAEADILTFHTPLDDTTYHMANAELFALMKPGATIINTSRGPVVDNKALLCSGHSFLLDVWENEPNLHPDLLKQAHIATPHIAGYSEQGKATATAMTVAVVAATFGFPLNGWYPPEAVRSVARKVSWQELCSTIGNAYDIAAESRRLKAQPEYFEHFRDNYTYRREYF